MTDPTQDRPPASDSSFTLLLLFSIFVIGTCGLVYELLASTIASYLIGDSVTQFSTVIGAYLFAMGLGSWCSRYLAGDPLRLFVRVEIMIALIGGWTAAGLFLLFPIAEHFRVVLYGLVLIIGVLVGLEIPLLMRVLKDRFAFNETISNVLTFDYVGALVASILFPLVLMPLLGLVRTGFMFGLLNVLVALGVIFRQGGGALGREKLAACLTLVALLAGFAWANRLQRWSETLAYGEKVIYAVSTPYQRIALTRNADDIRLFLNGNLQFLVAGRVSLPRVSRAPGHGTGRPSGQRPDHGRRRRPGRAGGAALPPGPARHSGRSRPGHDAAVHPQRDAAEPEQGRLPRPAHACDQCRRLPLDPGRHRPL